MFHVKLTACAGQTTLCDYEFSSFDTDHIFIIIIWVKSDHFIVVCPSTSPNSRHFKVRTQWPDYYFMKCLKIDGNVYNLGAILDEKLPYLNLSKDLVIKLLT